MQVQRVTDIIGLCGVGVHKSSSDAECFSDCFA